MDLQLICPIGSGAMSPVGMLVHAGLTTVVVSAGSVLLALGVRTYRRTAPERPNHRRGRINARNREPPAGAGGSVRARPAIDDLAAPLEHEHRDHPRGLLRILP